MTGGTGLVGSATVRALLTRGLRVRVLARAETGTDRTFLGGEVEFQRGNVGDALSMKGSAEGCDAIVHLAGVVRETESQTFQRINVDGTRNVLDEAARAGVTRVLYVSSLGADRGASEYHKSKFAAEQLVRARAPRWTIVRPGNVYGPGVGTIALFLRLVRTLPAVPAIGDPDTHFQPIWADDLAEAIARCVERDDLDGRILELAGNETTSQRDLLREFSRLTSRTPPLVPIPAIVASLGAKILEAVRVHPPITDDQITMYEEENVLASDGRGDGRHGGRGSDLQDVLGITPLPLREGMTRLAVATPEQLPSEGSGELVRRRFAIDMAGCTKSAADIIAMVQRDFAGLVPSATATVGSEQVSACELTPGATITLALPVRGNVQVRVEEVTATSITCLTLLGHPLAGAVRFEVLGSPTGELRFQVETIDRPANFFDGIAMATVGVSLKRMTWVHMCEKVAERSGVATGREVQQADDVLDGEDAVRAEEWMRGMIDARLMHAQHEREERGRAKSGAPYPRG